MESGSGSEQVEDKSGNEQEITEQPKKKRYHRHTARQIQEMEAYIHISLDLSSSFFTMKQTFFVFFPQKKTSNNLEALNFAHCMGNALFLFLTVCSRNVHTRMISKG